MQVHAAVQWVVLVKLEYSRLAEFKAVVLVLLRSNSRSFAHWHVDSQALFVLFVLFALFALFALFVYCVKHHNSSRWPYG